jgi:HlyD family secretion protein
MPRKLLTGPRVIGGIVVIVLLTALVFALRSPPVPVELGEVTRGPMTVTVNDLGETRVTNLYVVAAPISGQLLRVPLKPGDQVVPGATLLARIQPPDPAPLDPRATGQTMANIRSLEAQLSAAQSRISEARADRTLAEREFARTETLAERGFAALATLDRARSTRDRARAAVTEAIEAADAARHSLESARATLITADSPATGRGAVSVTSPVPGYVLRVPQESERVVAAGTTLVEVGDPDRLEMVTDLLSADAVRVRPGAAVLIEDWGEERPLRGRVRLVEPFGFLKISALGVEEQRVNVVIDFVEPRQAWRRLGHGYRATIRIATWSAPDVVRLPVSALFRTGSAWSVFAVDEDDRARLTRVEVGQMNDEMAQVLGGLAPGTRVILHAGDRIEEGVEVRQRAE